MPATFPLRAVDGHVHGPADQIGGHALVQANRRFDLEPRSSTSAG